MAIPYYLQYYTESERNNKYGWLSLGLGLCSLVLYGIVFHWSQILIRRTQNTNRFYFQLLRIWDLFNSSVPVPFTTKYFQPSLLLLWAGYLGINGTFMFVETIDLDYQPRFYIVGKRIGKIAASNFPLLYLFAVKNDPIPFITGLPHDKLNMVHRWMGRSVWMMVLTHLTISIKYWLSMDFEIMLKIPPQIFGMIAFGCMTILTWASMRIFRRLSYEFFLFNHGISAGIMMLFALFHNPASRAYVILAIHTVVLDRVISFVRAFVNKKLSPTKSIAELSLLDDEGTVEVRLALKKLKHLKWYMPNIGTWSVGQHVYLRVGGVRKVQWHPFTVASMPESEELRLVIRPHTGFSKAIGEKIKEKLEEDAESDTSVVKMLSLVHGPYGGRFIPLITFNTVYFVSGGTGSSFTLPIALDLVQTIKRREEAGDFAHRPAKPSIRVIWYIPYEKALNWYKDLLAQLSAYDVQVDIYVTREPQPEEIEDGIGLEKKVSISDSTASSCSMYSVTYMRPDIRDIIRSDPGINDKSTTMALVSCGPSSLTDQVQMESQKCMRHGKDVYTYVEKYTV